MPARPEDQGEGHDSAPPLKPALRAPRSTHERCPDTRRIVLKGVYEDNLGLPRSFNGKRSAPGEPVPDRDRPLSGKAGKVAIAALLASIALLGLGFRIVYPESARPDAVTARASQTALLPAPTALDLRPPLAPLADFTLGQGALVAGNTTAQYDAMLGRLDIAVADLFDLNVQTIVIDPGHGGRDPGAIGRDGLEEKDIVLDIARRLRAKLVAAGNYRVLLTRDDDSMVRLKDRVKFATENEADLFISIHINSVPEQAGGVNYVETYYFGPHEDQRTLDLAEMENHGSGYAMGDFRDIIARIGDTLKTEESARLASAIHNRLYSNLKRHGSGLLDAGIKSGPFVVLLGVEVPSVLVEISCISNEAEAERLGTPQYRDSIAGYLETGVVQYLNQRTPHIKQDGVSKEYVAQQDG